MTVLSDTTLRQMFPDYPWVGPASVDVHLGDTLLMWPHWITRDPRTDQGDRWQSVKTEDGVWVIETGRRYLCATRERVLIPNGLAAQIDGRSSWGRDGLSVHITAGWLDPGFEGTVTLELSVTGSKLVIWPGARVAQIVFFELDAPATPYAGKYVNQRDPTPSRTHEEVAA